MDFASLGRPLKIREEIGRVLAGGDGGFLGAGFGLAQKIVDKGLRVDFFLDEEGRGLDLERCGGFPAPNELGIEVGVAAFRFRGHGRGVARVGDGDGCLDLIPDDLLHLGGGDVFPRGTGVGDVGDFPGLGGGFLFGGPGKEWKVAGDQ